ncbi:MAG: alcohol dehydrogenase catalytic domain-containing protein, partial [Thermoproteota archaeon]|nr:alcohol dehydrogenase catalytic domain-containing protein [Thermoproteota archaeon]
EPETNDHDVLVRVKVAGVNPIDNFVVSGALPKLIPLPNHIPGAEISGIVEELGSHVRKNNLKKGDRVVIYNKVFDGTCDMCLNGLEMVCRNGGLIGVVTNGGFAEYISVPERNVFKIPDSLDWDTAASLPVTSLTPYHALREASLKINEYIAVFGASGSTGMIAVQLAKKMGAKVIAVSKHKWIKENEFGGADYLISDYNRVADEVKDITEGKMADVVLNSLGVETWENSYASIGINGRWVTFGTLSGPDIKLNLRSLYTRQIKLLGSTGGTRRELQEVIDLAANKEIRVKVWKKLRLDNVKEAIEALSAEERDGRILLEIT